MTTRDAYPSPRERPKLAAHPSFTQSGDDLTLDPRLSGANHRPRHVTNLPQAVT